ncbi:MAG: glycyl-radical enzyme activating protein [Promethearchaeota archaeon]
MVEKSAVIFNIQKLSTEDGPGIRTTVFFKGCPLRCRWCHNPEGIDPRPQLIWTDRRCIGCKTCIEICENNALILSELGVQINRKNCIRCGVCAEACPSTALELIGKSYTLENLFIEVEKDRPFYEQSQGGVTCSGGEATMQFQFLAKFLKICQQNKTHTVLDTCGFIKRKNLEKILPFVDLILYDLKILNSRKHKEYTGVPNDLILDNAKYIAKQGIPMWIRTPVIPGHTNSEKNIKEIALFITAHLLLVVRYDLCAFVNFCKAKYERLGINWFFKDTPLLTKSDLEHLAELARENGVPNVVWSRSIKRES